MHLSDNPSLACKNTVLKGAARRAGHGTFHLPTKVPRTLALYRVEGESHSQGTTPQHSPHAQLHGYRYRVKYSAAF